jgi:hypothetical protein
MEMGIDSEITFTRDEKGHKPKAFINGKEVRVGEIFIYNNIGTADCPVRVSQFHIDRDKQGIDRLRIEVTRDLTGMYNFFFIDPKHLS